jgi:hypothetical protein
LLQSQEDIYGITIENGHIVEIEITDNNVKGGIPSSIGCLKMLRKVVLSSNLLAGEVPIELGQCVSLQVIDLSHNAFSGPIPRELGLNCRYLITAIFDYNMYVTRNVIFSLPFIDPHRFEGAFPAEEFTHIVELKGVGMAHNKLSGAKAAARTLKDHFGIRIYVQC